jgi:hypothetical protein
VPYAVRNLQPSSDVVVHEQAGEAFLLHIGSGRYFGLNPSGLVTWKAIAQGQDPEDALREAYPEVAAERLRADLEELVASLLSEGLLQESPESS